MVPRRTLFLPIAALGLSAAGPLPRAAAAVPPSGHWQTMETAHFRIHFYDGELDLATRAAFIAERAWGILTRSLNWVPAGRVDITLTDQTDGANGFASSVPFNYVYGFGVPPDSFSSLNDFDDWLTVLLTHELTHVVHLDITLGLSRVVNFVLGKTLAPNQLQPNWFIEGLAVYHESTDTTSGRLHNSLYDMFLRAAVLQDRFLGLDAVSNGPRAYPGGEAAYLYGSAFLKYLADRFGPEKLAEISHRYGRRFIPLALNRTAREALGLRYDELWEDWKAALRRRYALQAEEVRRRGLTPARRLTFEGEGGGGGPAPRFFPDGSVVYHMAHSYARPAFVRVDPATGRRSKIADINLAEHPAPTPDGRSLVFEQTSFIPLKRRITGSSHADWSDLFRLDLETGDVRQLTSGARAHEPEVSPDGTQIACTVGSGVGLIDLAVIPVDGGSPRILAHGSDRDIAFNPTWSPDGARIAYSRWRLGGFRDLHVYDLRAGADRTLWTDRALDVDPDFSPDGRFLLLSSDRTGIYDIYAYELATGRLFQVTNVLGGAFQPVVSPDGRRLVFTGYSADGFDLYTQPFDPSSWLPAPPFVNARDDAAIIGPAPAGGEKAAPAPGRPESLPPIVQRTRPYQPWRYMYPRAWSLAFSSDSLGLGPDVTVGTSLSDPAVLHGLALRADIPIGGDASVRADYGYTGLWPWFGASVSRAAYRNGGLVVDGASRDYLEHSLSASASTSLPVLRRPDSSSDIWMGYGWNDTWMAGSAPEPNPTQGITRLPEHGPSAGIFLGWSFSNVQSYNYSVSGQEGRRLQVDLDVNDPALGSRFRTAEVSWSWTEFWTPPWATLQALGLSYSGGVGIGDKRAIFRIGGFAEQDLIRAFFLDRRQCCTFLRGYKAASIEGDQYHVASLEYRLPLLWMEKGYETFPVYLRRLHGAVFTDVGDAFYGDLNPRRLRTSVGGELRFEFQLAYYLPALLQIGLARGLARDGITDFYLASGFPF